MQTQGQCYVIGAALSQRQFRSTIGLGRRVLCFSTANTLHECVINHDVNVHVHMKIKSFSSRCKQSYVYIEYFLLVCLV